MSHHKSKHQLLSQANRSSENAQHLHSICKDINNWPGSWAGDDNDLVAGHLILEVFIQYLLSLLDKGRAKSTVRKHANYLWALGGEIIRDTNDRGFDPTVSAVDLLLQYVQAEGGPYWRHADSQDDLRQYDSTCRSLYKFLTLK